MLSLSPERRAVLEEAAARRCAFLDDKITCAPDWVSTLIPSRQLLRASERLVEPGGLLMLTPTEMRVEYWLLMLPGSMARPAPGSWSRCGNAHWMRGCFILSVPRRHLLELGGVLWPHWTPRHDVDGRALIVDRYGGSLYWYRLIRPSWIGEPKTDRNADIIAAASRAIRAEDCQDVSSPRGRRGAVRLGE